MGSARVVMFSASFGNGHDAAARDLARRLRQRGVEVRIFDFVDALGPRVGPGTRSAYARQLAYAPSSWGRTLDLLGRPKMVGRCASLSTRLAGNRVLEAVGDADAVVSTYPLASLVLGKLRRTGQISAPVMTFFTDISVHPLWVTPDIDVHLAPHQLAATQARAAAELRGPVVVTAPAVDTCRFQGGLDRRDRDRIRTRFGLPTGARLALISSGAWGVGAVAQIARDVARTGQALPVVVCARNDDLRRRLARRGWGPTLGWVDDMPELIASCDVVVTNAFGITGLEAVACGVPVVAYRPLPGHGAANAHALHEIGLGRYATSLDDLAKHLIDPWPVSFSPYALPRPAAIYDAPDPAEAILECAGLTSRTPAGVG